MQTIAIKSTTLPLNPPKDFNEWAKYVKNEVKKLKPQGNGK